MTEESSIVEYDAIILISVHVGQCLCQIGVVGVDEVGDV